MAVTSVVQIAVNLSGDITYGQQFSAASNTNSPGSNAIVAVTNGDTTISIPTGATGVTIIPPDGNTDTLTIKGDASDVGIGIGLTDPMFLSFASGASSFIVAATASLNLRLIWS